MAGPDRGRLNEQQRSRKRGTVQPCHRHVHEAHGPRPVAHRRTLWRGRGDAPGRADPDLRRHQRQWHRVERGTVHLDGRPASGQCQPTANGATETQPEKDVAGKKLVSRQRSAAWKVEVVACTTNSSKGKPHKGCTTEILERALTISTKAKSAKATLRRAGKVYATGTLTRPPGPPRLRSTSTHASDSRPAPTRSP